jgi:hypothetical protein
VPGCGACIPEEPTSATALGLAEDARLVVESHFMVKIRSCRACGQRFLWVFAEQIDLVDGNDPQCWSVLPISPEEAEAMIEAGEDLDLDALSRLGMRRRFLRDDSPAFGPRNCLYVYGPLIRPQDR